MPKKEKKVMQATKVLDEADSSGDEVTVEATKESTMVTSKAPMKRKPNVWLRALKKWNNKRNDGVWMIPKKGSPEYAEVAEIMKKIKDKKKISA